MCTTYQICTVHLDKVWKLFKDNAMKTMKYYRDLTQTKVTYKTDKHIFKTIIPVVGESAVAEYMRTNYDGITVINTRPSYKRRYVAVVNKLVGKI